MSRFYKPAFGSRFVFFSQLLEDENPLARRLGENARAHFSHFLTNAAQENDYTDFTDLMKNNISILQNIAANSYQNEQQFLSHHLDYVKKEMERINDEHNSQYVFLKQLKTNIENCQKSRDPYTLDTNYKDLITGLNLLHKDNLRAQEALQKLKQQLKNNQDKNIDPNKEITIEFKEAGKKQTNTVTKTLKNFFLESGGEQYRQAFLTAGLEKLENKLVEDQTKKINNTIKTICNSPSLLEEFNQKFQLTKVEHYSSRETNELLEDIIVHLTLSDYNRSTDDIIKELKQIKLEDIINYDKLIPYTSQAFTRAEKQVVNSFEQLALQQSTELTQYVFSQLSIEQRKIFLSDKSYGKYLSPKIKTLIGIDDNNLAGKDYNQFTSHQRGAITKALRQAFINKMSKEYKEQWEELHHDLKKYSPQLNKQFLSSINSKDLTIADNVLQKNLRVELKKDGYAELMSNLQYLLSKQASQYSSSHTIGKALEVKYDMIFTTSFSDLTVKDVSLKDQINKFIDDVNKFMENFISQYHKQTKQLNKGGTDIKLAYNIYMEAMKALGNQYTQLRDALSDDLEAQQQLDNYISNTFFGGISTKEYAFYNEQLGFKGGSIGGSFNAIKGIDTIYDMMEIGGINRIDKEVIIEAVLNSGQGTILSDNNAGIIDQVKNYLIGGAVLSMFDNGFANTENVLQEIANFFGNNTSPRAIELVQADTLLVPASYILQRLCYYLNNIYTKTESEIKLISPENIEFYNQVSVNDINESLPTPYARWTALSTQAQTQTKLRILLLAGLLDIFDNLEVIIEKPLQ